MSVPCTIPRTGSFFLMDFQGQCLTVDISVSSPFVPIISNVCQVGLPAEPWQTVCLPWISNGSHMVDIVMQWSLALVNHGSHCVQTPLHRDSAQVREEVFELNPNNGRAGKKNSATTTYPDTLTLERSECPGLRPEPGILVNNLVGTEITLTSTQGSGQFNHVPIIFEPLTGSLEQIWTIVALDSRKSDQPHTIYGSLKRMTNFRSPAG
ncbi:hypothetical protein B0H14DRAFT_2641014 [Mycena olivaceomarginata]|nr:hypothetical protein B0H14DRAFT_2641014 [Mycena olivaceomarginata]